MNLILLLGSVAGVLGLAWVARMLELGGGRIADENEARRLAEDSQLAFTAAEVFLSTDGKSALVRALDDRWTVLKVHGANIAARELRPLLALGRSEDGVTIASGERMFGNVALQLRPDDRKRLALLLDVAPAKAGVQIGTEEGLEAGFHQPGDDIPPTRQPPDNGVDSRPR